MTTNELKEILATKLHNEGCYFTKKHIHATKTKSGFKVVIKDYEHIPFTVYAEEDDYLGYCVYVCREGREFHLSTSKRTFPWEEAIIYLGYYIGSRF